MTNIMNNLTNSNINLASDNHDNNGESDTGHGHD
jgi:hypothetical protein